MHRQAAFVLLGLVSIAGAACRMPNPAYDPPVAAGGTKGIAGSGAGGGATGAGGASGASGASGTGGAGGASSAGGRNGTGGAGGSGAGGDRDAGGPDEAPARPPPDLKTGLLCYLTFDDLVGGYAVPDASGEENNAGFLYALADVPSAWTTGWSGSGLAVAVNSTQALTIPALDPVDQLTSFTFAAWVYRAAIPGNGRAAIVTRQLGTGNGEYYNFGLVGDNLVLTIAGTGAVPLTLQGQGNVPRDTWIHLAATFGSNVARLYISGVEVASGPHSAGFPASDNPVLVGNKSNAGGRDQALGGRLDQVLLYTRALPAAAIAALAASPTPLPPPLPP